MKLPFVSRARFEMALHNLEEMRKLIHAVEEKNEIAQRFADGVSKWHDDAESHAATWKALFDAERIRTEGLTEKLLQMKQQGFTSAAQRIAEPAREPSRIDATIAERAGTNSALRRHLTRWAAQRLEMKVSEDEIVDALTHWRDPDADEAEA